MMKKILLMVFCSVLSLLAAHAQMSDGQIVEYVKQQHAAGVDQNTIAKSLLAKGVTKEQLMRIQQMYQKSQSVEVASSGGGTLDRDRELNGETVADALVSFNSEPEVKIFGHDIFRSKSLTFEPNMNIATPASYVLGPGDEVIIDVYGASQKTSKYKVSPEGLIVVEKIGPVAVSGLTVEQAQAKVRGQMGMHYQGSSINLTVGQTRTVVVNVLGEVTNPGTYTLSAFSTVFNALYLAGGITDIGTLRNIKVTRNGRTISTVDVYDFIINGKLTGNVMLNDNDAIIVGAYDALVSIDGAIKRPMLYEMKKGESLKSLLTYSGGFVGDANKSVVNVERKTSEGYTVHTVNEWDFTSFGMEDGDSVVINNIVKRYQNMVEVSGAVFYPGHYSMSDGCSSIKGLVDKAGGLIENAFQNRAVLYRMNEDRTRKTMSIDLKNILTGSVPDVVLANEDSLVIAYDEQYRYSRKYYMLGPLVKEGEFDYAEGMTLEDAIVAAGGLREDAMLCNVEVSRRIQYTDIKDTTYMKQTEIFTFDIEDGLLLGKGKEFLVKPFDAISIKRNPEFASSQFVYIGGEVKYPGAYVLKSKTDRISDIIVRAGGLRANAFADGAKFTRRMNEEEKERAEQLLEMARTESDSVSTDKIDIKERYSVGIDLNKIMKKPGCLEDIVLRDGDNIVIPTINNTVKINGEVLYPNVVAFVEGKSGKYYLNQAGGVSSKGVKRNAYIIYPNGQVSRMNKGKVTPGCEIVVPTKQKKEENTQKSSLYLAGASTIATIAAVLITAFRR